MLDAGHGHEAFEHLSRAYLIDPQNARFRSSYALALALVRGQYLGAVELARAAVRQEFYNPDLYLNLARIYLAFDFKPEAIHNPTDRPYKEFLTGRRHAWAEDRVM